MIRVHVIAEGPTEETFIEELLKPALLENGVLATASLIGPTGAKGGNVSYQRLKRDVVKYLKGDPTAYCTTLIDYYGLGPGFPARAGLGKFDPTDKKKQTLEAAIHRDIADELSDRYDHSHFIPYVQMHEFEGLLFSDPVRFASGICGGEAPELARNLRQIRDLFATPEDINDDKKTAPSKRIQALYPGYNKEFLGNLAALEIGLGAIRATCPRFDAWVNRLERLGPTSAGDPGA